MRCHAQQTFPQTEALKCPKYLFTKSAKLEILTQCAGFVYISIHCLIFFRIYEFCVSFCKCFTFLYVFWLFN